MNHTRRGQGPHDAYRSYSQPDTMPVGATGRTMPSVDAMTWRESQCLQMHEAGKSDYEIGQFLRISSNAAGHYIKEAKSKRSGK